MKFMQNAKAYYAELTGGKTFSDMRRTWNKYFNVEQRDSSGLLKLLESDARDEFKAMAMLVFLMPDLSLLPVTSFRWKDRGTGELKSLATNFYRLKLSKEVLSFCVRIIPDAMQYVRQNRQMKKLGYASSILYEYHELILCFLNRMEITNPFAQQLFDSYDLNDQKSFTGGFGGGPSGYNPFANLLSDEDLPIHWKVLADAKMRELVLLDLSGKINSRETWEAPARCYVRHISERLITPYSSKRYDMQLLVSQIEFLLSEETSSYRGPFLGGDALYGIWCYKDPYVSLLHKLARVAVVKDRGEYGFVIHEDKNSDSYRVAQIMLRDFGPVDEELRLKLQFRLEVIDQKQNQILSTKKPRN